MPVNDSDINVGRFLSSNNSCSFSRKLHVHNINNLPNTWHTSRTLDIIFSVETRESEFFSVEVPCIFVHLQVADAGNHRVVLPERYDVEYLISCYGV